MPLPLLYQVLPHVGDKISVAAYRAFLLKAGYAFPKVIGSLGGASRASAITIDAATKIVTRLR